MKKLLSLKPAILISIFALVLTACGNTTNSDENDSEDTKAKTVEITDAHGTHTVPVNPETVISLDNRTYKTLDDWGVKLAAAPKPVISEGISYKTDDSVQDIGSHNEPNLEVIAAANPDLVIVGQRFGSYYEDIKALVPDAVVIDLNIDVSEEAETPGENLVNGFKDATETLGLIFDKEEEAKKIITDFDTAIDELNDAYDTSETIMTIIVSGGDIRFAAPQTGRVWGPLYEIFGWTSSLDIDGTSSDHQGDSISVEAIAQSNPDWIFVLDRDAATSSADGAVPASDVISNSPALQNITAVTSGQVVYAPNDTYTNESIQTFITLFGDITNALSK